MATIKVVPWRWRDGSIHLEVRTVTLIDDESGLPVCHLDNERTTHCGIEWSGRLSSSGISHSQRINCEECRDILSLCSFQTEAPVRAES